MLCEIYFLALHDEYYKSRDMMLTSHLQETIASFDINTQILFNRTWCRSAFAPSARASSTTLKTHCRRSAAVGGKKSFSPRAS